MHDIIIKDCWGKDQPFLEVDKLTVPNGQGGLAIFYSERGSGGGDMDTAVYDPNGDVASAGGIPRYVEAVRGQASFFGTCSTSASTTAKIVTCSGFQLATGARIAVKFSNHNTATAPTLNVNNTGAKTIKSYGTTAPEKYLWHANEVVPFVYDGIYWQIEGVSALAASTNYPGLMSAADKAKLDSLGGGYDAVIMTTVTRLLDEDMNITVEILSGSYSDLAQKLNSQDQKSVKILLLNQFYYGSYIFKSKTECYPEMYDSSQTDRGIIFVNYVVFMQGLGFAYAWTPNNTISCNIFER